MDYEIGLNILKLMQEEGEGDSFGGSITTTTYSMKLNLPLVLALGQLENAEKLGMICRDEIMEQITFYPVQIFDTFCKLNVAKKQGRERERGKIYYIYI